MVWWEKQLEVICYGYHTGRISIKVCMILLNQGCYIYISGYEWWNETHIVEEITSELN
jgi:hypothetical protein